MEQVRNQKDCQVTWTQQIQGLQMELGVEKEAQGISTILRVPQDF